MHELITAMTIGYFDAISKVYSENILKFLWGSGRNFIFFRYVTAKSWSPSPQNFHNGLSQISWTPSLPLLSYVLIEWFFKCYIWQIWKKSLIVVKFYIRILHSGVSALFTEFQHLTLSGKYGIFNFRASIVFYSKI